MSDTTARRGRSDRGALLMLVAICLPVLIIATSFAVDLGMQRASRRTMQARADIIALDLSRLLDGSSANALRLAPSTETAIQASADRNNITRAKVISVDWGNLDASNQFVSGTTAAAEAVKVTTSESTKRIFQTGSGQVTRSAVARASGVASFEIGSKLVTFSTSQAALLNGLFTKVLGGNVNLSAATYQGLAGSGVNIGDLAAQLGFASPSQLAGATVNAKQLYLASATVLQNHGYTAAANVLNLIAAQTNNGLTVPMGKLMSIQTGGDAAALAGSFDALNLLQGSVYAINGSSAITIPSLDLGIPNVGSTTVTLNVIQGPVWTSGPVGAHISTAQASITVTPTLNAGLQVLAGLNLLSVTGSIPLTASVAGATGTLTAIACGTPKSISVGVAPQPVTITSGLNLSIKTLGLLPVATIATSLSASPTGSSNGGTFLYPTQFMPTVGTGTWLAAPTTPLGLSGLLTVGSPQVTIVGLPLGTTLGGLVTAVNGLVNPILANIDTAITGSISHALGLDIGGADIGALDMTCNNPLLVG